MLQIRSATQVSELSKTWLGDDMKRTCCLCCTQSGLFDPWTDAQSGLKWAAVSVKCLYVLWPAVLVSHSLSVYFEHGHGAIAGSFNLSTRAAFFPCCKSKTIRVALNDPTGGETSVLARSNNPSDVGLGPLRQPKSSHRPSAEFILAPLLPEGTSICTSAVPQSISAWTNTGEKCFCSILFMRAHTPVRVSGQRVYGTS